GSAYQPSAISFPFSDDPGVFGTAFRCTIRAQEHVAAPAHAVGERDHGIDAGSSLFPSVAWNVVRHTAWPFCPEPSAHFRVLSRTVKRRQVHLTGVFGRI